MPKINITKTELVWLGKYDEEGKLNPVEKPGPYPFQIVEVINKPRTGKEIPTPGLLFDLYEGKEGNTFEEGWRNKLIWGDNKLVMSSLLEKFAGRINLIYIDPPFATGADFKFKIQIGEEAEEITKEHSIIEEKAYRDTWGKGLDSYLQMMYERLVLMKELLAENGSIYVHLDWHVGHYVKVMMDEIFGYENFRNDVIWHYFMGGKTEKGFAHKHDIILFYTKSDNFFFNENILKWYRILPYKPSLGSHKEIKEVLCPKCGNGVGMWMSEVKLDDVWDISGVFNMSQEYQAFTTQKPEALLKRIILASSNPGDIVADFFCGSGTTLAVAEKLGRRWIGCDLSRYAIHITRKRLLEIENSKDLENEGKKYGKKARPFEILNLGKYERQLWQVRTFSNKDEKQALFEYLAFILKLYGAEPISGFTHIHGKKGSALVYVGAVDAPVTIQEVTDAIQDCKKAGQKELHILGWEWEMGLNDAIQEIAKREEVRLKLRIIP
ncbi:MAG: site-specific DNA-methyltransferase, partial [Caldisericum sp.]|uniref:site-specific DNA-methyltransferase n=1 Tax=Caldisericum sp. TaxID=2499687 RepID=UPI003D11D65E